MPANRVVAIVVLVIGVGLLAVALLADVIGFGNYVGFGPHQQRAAVAGFVISALGFWLFRKSSQ
jgi:hypothetical protein